MRMPPLGFGTFRLQGDVVYQSVSHALKYGYTHIDTAQAYGNEAEVGKAIADSGVNRQDIFITTKVWNDNLSAEKMLGSVNESLEKLRLDYVNLLLVHWPSPPEGIQMEEYLTAIHRIKEQGLTKEIGLSNFTIPLLEQVKETLPLSTFYTNQVEVHPYLQNNRLREYCKSQKLHITAYMPFAYGKVLKDSVITTLADKYNQPPAAIVLAWLRQKDLAAIPSSTKASNIKANLTSLDLTLSAEDIALIDQLERGDRQANPDFSPVWDE